MAEMKDVYALNTSSTSHESKGVIERGMEVGETMSSEAAIVFHDRIVSLTL